MMSCQDSPIERSHFLQVGQHGTYPLTAMTSAHQSSTHPPMRPFLRIPLPAHSRSHCAPPKVLPTECSVHFQPPPRPPFRQSGPSPSLPRPPSATSSQSSNPIHRHLPLAHASMRATRHHHPQPFQNRKQDFPFHQSQYEEVANGLQSDLPPPSVQAAHHRTKPMSSSRSPCKSAAGQRASDHWHELPPQLSTAHRPPDIPISFANHRPYRHSSHIASQTISR